MPATRKFLVLDVIMGIWGVLSVVAMATAVVALVDASAMVSAALSLCNRGGDMDCDDMRSVTDELLIWPARMKLALYIATFLVPVGYSIWRVRCSVPSAPLQRECTAATVVETSSV